MPLRHRRAIAAAAAAGALLAAAVADVLASGDPTTSAVGARAGHDAQAALGRRPVPLPRFIYAPYFETWHTESLPSVAQKSGARYLTLAFLQTTKKGSCTLAWNGKQLVQPGGRYSTQIAELRHAGGDVIPSFGGFGADHDDTEIADSCTSVAKIASAYENVVTTYGVTRLDMDIEDKSLTRKAGIARRSAAIALLQKWAARTHRRVQVAFTLSVEPGGLSDSGLAVLKSAISHGVRVDAVNIMAFDYYNAKTDSDMGSEAIEALTSTHRQLMRLFPHVPAQRLWYLEGITLMPGIDDFPGKTEVTYLSEVQALLSYVQRHPIQAFSIWSVQRDNGGCPGAGSSGTCSGITQPRWAFSHLLDSYSRS
ncbi:MAG TPA: chitinase [Streptosporangiaceae bacterium]|nr:chitinase [Streptosporangiaceae bacterium]